jgi:hypothetical protein
MKKSLTRSLGIPLLAALLMLSSAPALALADSGKSDRTFPFLSLERASFAANADGKALIRGAKVTGVSGADITATVALGSATLTMTLHTDSATKFYNRAGKTELISDIAVGDTVTAGGTMTGNGLTMNAAAVKDFTGAVENISVSGKIDSINLSALSFFLDKSKSGNGDDKKIEVKTTGGTAFTINGVASAFASLLQGDKVKVDGSLNAEGTILTATAVSATHVSASNNPSFNSFLKDFFKGDKGKGRDHAEDN